MKNKKCMCCETHEIKGIACFTKFDMSSFGEKIYLCDKCKEKLTVQCENLEQSHD